MSRKGKFARHAGKRCEFLLAIRDDSHQFTFALKPLPISASPRHLEIRYPVTLNYCLKNQNKKIVSSKRVLNECPTL